MWRAAFFVALFGFAGFVVSDVVFDALNVDDLEVFGFPDDDVTFVGKTTVEDHISPFFGRDLPPRIRLASFPFPYWRSSKPNHSTTLPGGIPFVSGVILCSLG